MFSGADWGVYTINMITRRFLKVGARGLVRSCKLWGGFLAGIFMGSVRYDHPAYLYYILDLTSGSAAYHSGDTSFQCHLPRSLMNWRCDVTLIRVSQQLGENAKTLCSAKSELCFHKGAREGKHATMETSQLKKAIWAIRVVVISVQTQVVKIISNDKTDPNPLNTSYIMWCLD